MGEKYWSSTVRKAVQEVTKLPDVDLVRWQHYGIYFFNFNLNYEVAY